jgi:nucleoside diphosphate kinase
MPAGNWTFGLITPDGLLTGSFDAITTRLHEHGFEIVAGRLLGVDVARMHRMYHHTDQPPPPTGTDELPPSVMGRLYRQAPALVVVLTGPARSASEQLLRAKGDKRPSRARPDSVRRAGEHLIFNFLHSPDDAGSAESELAHLVGPAEAEGLIAMALSGARGLSSLLGAGALRGSLPAFAGWDVLSFPMAANRLRRRAVQRIAVAGHDDPDCLGHLLAAQQALDDERRALAELPEAQDRLRVSVLASPAVHDPLVAADARAGTGLGEGLAALASLLQADGPRDPAAVHALADRSLYLSPLEKLAIEAHRHALRADEDPAMDPPPGLSPMLGAMR